jgi:nicotinamide riboside kinase
MSSEQEIDETGVVEKSDKPKKIIKIKYEKRYQDELKRRKNAEISLEEKNNELTELKLLLKLKEKEIEATEYWKHQYIQDKKIENNKMSDIIVNQESRIVFLERGIEATEYWKHQYMQDKIIENNKMSDIIVNQESRIVFLERGIKTMENYNERIVFLERGIKTMENYNERIEAIEATEYWKHQYMQDKKIENDKKIGMGGMHLY